MRSFAAFATAALVAVSSADVIKRDEGACMTQAEAQQVADNFQVLIADYDATVAENALTVDFHDASDSVSSLINAGCPLPQPVSRTGNIDRPTEFRTDNVSPSSASSPSPAVRCSWLPRVRSPRSTSSS